VLTETAARSGRPLVFGHGNNPVNFVSVTDVAALIEHAVTDPAARGRVLEIGGPDNHTFNQIAAAVQAAAARAGPPRHVPPPILRIMASTLGRIKPELGRKARAALIMDRAPLTYDAAGARQAYPGLPCAPLSTCLQA
jgi:nucleoside-diphosphate-sugar epimerase